MQIVQSLLISFLANTLALAEESPAPSTGDKQRDVIVSHTDEKGILQLYRKKRRRLEQPTAYLLQEKLPHAVMFSGREKAGIYSRSRSWPIALDVRR